MGRGGGGGGLYMERLSSFKFIFHRSFFHFIFFIQAYFFAEMLYIWLFKIIKILSTISGLEKYMYIQLYQDHDLGRTNQNIAT